MKDNFLVDKKENRCVRCNSFSYVPNFYKKVRVGTKWYKLCDYCHKELEEWLKAK